jgi:hypothetical protein
MRVLVSGLIVLGFVVAVLPPERQERPSPVASDPGPAAAAATAPAARIGVNAADPSTRQPGSGQAREDLRPGTGASAAARVVSGEPIAASPERAGTLSPEAKPAAQGAAFEIRARPSGAKTPAQAIASRLDSDEFADAISPVTRLYFGYFDRAPDYEGLDYYIGERERGTPLDAIAQEFAGSLEFELRYGELDNAGFVDRVYHNVFGAPGDAAQRAYWIDRLDSGAMTRGQVMLAFSESPEFRALTGNEVFVTTAYAETLRRAPDAAELSRWVRFLDSGNPRGAVIAALLANRRGK